MKKIPQKTTSNFFKANKELLIVGGTIVTLIGAGATWYYFKKKKQASIELPSAGNNSIMDNISIKNTPLNSSVIPIKMNSNTGSAVIKYGSRNADVKILQRYLKIYKEDLGSSGSNRDGVDGIFGPKTARAAKKRLGKAVFTKADIDGMRKTLKSMGK